jgi:hypothetical protein
MSNSMIGIAVTYQIIPRAPKRSKRHWYEKAKRMDHEYFRRHPDADSYCREPFPGEFAGELELLSPEKRWIVEIRGFFKSGTRECVARTRTPIEVRVMADAGNGIILRQK